MAVIRPEVLFRRGRLGPSVRRALALLCAACGLFVLTKPSAAQQRRKVAVPREIIEQMLKDEDFKYALEPKHENTVAGLSKYLVAELADLNRDGRPELLVHGINDICGPYWCTHRVYRKTGAGYQLLFEDDVADLQPQKTYTNGYRDIMTERHGSASESELTLYKFDGKVYTRRACFMREYRHREERRGVDRRPKVTRVKCEPEE